MPGMAPNNEMNRGRRTPMVPLLAVGLVTLAACTPTVRVEAPTEPIVINLNVRIEQEIRIKIDRELEELYDDRSDIF